MANAHAYFYEADDSVHVRMVIEGDDGIKDHSTASFPFGPHATTGDREELDALIRALGWYQTQASWVGSRTFEISCGEW